MSNNALLDEAPITLSATSRDTKIIKLSNGNLLAYWYDANTEDLGTDGISSQNIHAQLYGPDWTSIGSELVLNSLVGGAQSNPVVIALADGGFAASWYSENLGNPADQSSTHIAMRIFDADGSPLGAEFVANGVTAGFQNQFDLLALADGTIAALYRDSASDGVLRARFFDGSGNVIGNDLAIGGPETGRFYCDAQSLIGGGFIVTWSQIVGGKYDVRAQVFDGTGAAVAEAFTVNQDTTRHESFSYITQLSDGRLLVHWRVETFFNNISTNSYTAGRILNADGTAAGNEFILSQNADNGATVTALSDGGFAVAWVEKIDDNPNNVFSSNPDFGTFQWITAQRFDASGAAVGSEFQWEVKGDATNSPISYSIAITAFYETAPGHLAMVWSERETTFAPDGSGTQTGGTSHTRLVNFTTENFAPQITWQGGGDTATFQIAEEVPDSTLSLFGRDIGRVSVNELNGDRLTFSISGEDATFFTLDPVSGRLLLNQYANFENPSDQNADNVYRITITVSDGVNYDTQDVAITVTDVVNGVTLNGTSRGESLVGTNLEDTLNGLGGNDTLSGQTGDDGINGGAGSDTIIGGQGADILTGGAGRDTFVFNDINDSMHDLHDFVTDFFKSQNDRISLRGIDANVDKRGDQAFNFVGSTEFSGQAGELRYYYQDGDTFVEGDVNGDGLGDFLIQLDNQIQLTPTDFIL